MVRLVPAGQAGHQARFRTRAGFERLNDIVNKVAKGDILKGIESSFKKFGNRLQKAMNFALKNASSDFSKQWEKHIGISPRAMAFGTKAGRAASWIPRKMLGAGKKISGKKLGGLARAPGQLIAWGEGVIKSFISPLSEGLGRIKKNVLKPLQGTKTLKGLQAMSGMFKQAAGSVFQAWAMEQIVKLLEPFLLLLKPFEPLISVISGLLKAMFGEAMKPLMDLMMQLVPILIDLMPIFKTIGKVMGGVIANGIKILIGLFMKLANPLGFLIEIFESVFGKVKIFGSGMETLKTPLEKINYIISVIWNNLVEFGRFLTDVFNATLGAIFGENGLIAKGWKFVEWLWDNTVGKIFGKGGVMHDAFETTLDIIKNVINAAFIGPANLVIDIINTLPGVDIEKIPEFQHGGVVDSPTLGILGEAGQREIIFNEDQLSLLAESGFSGIEAQYLLRENNELLGQFIKLEKEKIRQGRWR